MRPRVKGALLLLVAFALGAGAGALAFGVYQARVGWWGPARGERFQQFLLRRLTRELDLSADQRQKVEAILRESGEDFARLREEIRPRFREIRGRARERIKAVLNPEQQEKFQALEEEWERRAERWRGEERGPSKKEPKGP